MKKRARNLCFETGYDETKSNKRHRPLPETFLKLHRDKVAEPEPLVFCMSANGMACHLESASETYHFRITLRALV